MIYTLRYLMMVLVEAICFMLFMGTFFDIKGKRKNVAYVTGTVIVFALGSVFSSIDVIFVRAAVAIMVWTFFSLFCFESKPLWKLILVFVYYGIILVSDGIVQLIVMIDKNIILNSDDAQYTVILILAKLIQLIIVIIIRLIFRKRIVGKVVSYKYMIIFLIVPAMTVVLMLVYLMVENHVAMVISAMIMLYLNVVFIIMMNIIFDKENKIEEIKFMEENAERQLSLYHNLEQAYNEQRKSTHEFRHHMECIYGLLRNNDYQNANEYVAKINGDYIDIIDFLDTGNSIVNTVLNQKIRYAKSKGISIISVSNNLSELKIEKEDIVVIMSNLLDNAIEACEKVKIFNKEIKLTMETDQEYMILTIKNPIEEKINVKEGRFLTTKGDKLQHGIGLSNVESIVKKYNGECMYSVKDNFFTYTIRIEY